MGEKILYIGIFISSIFLIPNKHLGQNSFKAKLFWEKNIIQKLNSKSHISIKIKSIIEDDIKNTDNYKIVSSDDYIVYYGENKYYYFTDSLVCMVDLTTNELFKDKVNGYFGSAFYGQMILKNIEFFDFYFFPKEINYKFKSIKDTIINSINYKILKRNKNNTYLYNKKTQKYDIPNFYTIDYYFNQEKELIDYIYVIPMNIEGNKAVFNKIEYFLDISFENKDREINNIFDLNKTEYQNFSFHNDNFLPYSWTWSNKKEEKLTDSILNFPIISVNDDTISIAMEKGWLLLDFWFFGCRSCRDWLTKLNKEKDSLGYRILEKNEIKILSINAITNNTAKILEEGDKLSAKDLLYHTKGLGNLIDISKMPKYYLISPDKKIIYVSNNIGDYSELLEQKKKYETKLKH